MRAICIFVLALLVGPPAQAQETPWPDPRSGHSMVWHDSLGTVLVYGGVRDGRDPRWLWSWDGLWWSVVDSFGPPAAGQFGFAYDSDRKTIVLHGGMGPPWENPTRYADTWEWSGTWRRIDGEGPGVRDHHAMAYDPDRRVVVLFGGSRSVTNESGEPASSLLGDTWTWDGATWRHLDIAGPPPRSTHRMVWDDRRKALLLFGGSGEVGHLGDLWAWDGTAWSRLDEGTGPSARFATRIAWDAARGELVLYGGRGAGGDFEDTWIWDGNAWARRDVEGPGPLNVHEMAYDAKRKSVVLFGGFHDPDQWADVWEWDGELWEHFLPD